MRKMIRRSPRGYVMLVVVLIGIALVAIATSTMSVAGAAATAAAKTEEGEQARAYAESGMQRAMAYLDAVGATEADFDLVLDPAAALAPTSGEQCDGSPTLLSGEHQPRYTVGATVQRDVDFDDRRWTRVSLGDGAYLIRFDDDDDDQLVDPDFAAFTGNRQNGVRNCFEGPGAAGTDIAGLDGQNPFRDRNRSVWITVMGFGPGTNVAQAQHRHTLRQLYTYRGPLPPEPAVAAGTMAVDGGGQFSLCSTFGGIGIVGPLNMNGPGPQNQTCGPVVAGSNGANSFGDNSSSCAPGTCTPPPATTQTGTVTLPDHPDHTDLVGNPTDPATCVFYFSDASNDGGLYFWDDARSGCSTFPAVRPEPDGVAPGPQADCWSPIFVHNGSSSSPLFFAVIPAEMNGPVWEPTDTASTTTVTSLAPGFTHDYSGWTGTITKPAWSTCGAGLTWERPSTPAASMSCAGACNGSNGVIEFLNGRVRLLGANPRAFPAGIYFRDQSFVVSQNASGFTAPPDDQDRNEWPAVTLVVEEDFTADGAFALGFGTAGPELRVPSLVVDGNNLTYNSPPNTVFAGSVWAATNMTFNSTPSSGPQFHGTIVVGGNLNISSGAKMDIVYDHDLGTGGGVPPTVASVTSSPGSY